MPPVDDAASNKKWWIIIASSGLGLSLIMCCCGTCIIGAITFFGDPHPAKLVGPWKGRFDFNTGPVDVVYNFRTDGTYRQESFNPAGVKDYQHEGRWGHRNGVVKLSWGGDGYERATVKWLDDNTFHYRITDQDDARQIGMTTTFKRQ